MRREQRNAMLLVAVMLALAVVVVIVTHNAKAEALLSLDAAALLALSGDLRLSDAPMDIYVADCLRVDVVSVSADGAWAELKLPYVPPSIWGVALYDGWHLIYAAWEPVGDNALQLQFRAKDLARLDGTVGLYLVILAEEGDHNAAD